MGKQNNKGVSSSAGKSGNKSGKPTGNNSGKKAGGGSDIQSRSKGSNNNGK